MSYLKRVLEEKHMSQKDLARRTGISATTINRYCNKKYGKLGVENIKLVTLFNLSTCLGVEIGEFVEGVMNDD